jgi:glycosyltransferase involved in cell wall biosynthesis
MSAVGVVHLVEALGVGGLERVVQSLSRHADPRRYRVEVVCAARGGPLAEEIEEAGTPVRLLGAGSYYPRDILRLARLLKGLAPHVVHSHGHFAGVLGRAAAWWAGVPVLIHHLHTTDTTLRDRHRRLERLLARVTRRVVCCSRAVERHALLDLGLDKGLTITVLNGIDPAPMAGAEEAHRLLGRPARPIVGCVGGLSRHKGQEHLVRAFAALPERLRSGTLALVGDGPGRAHLEEMVAALGLRGRVLFLGERRDARRLLPAFDVVAVPSVCREGLGLAALEAMDAARPVVATRVGGLPEVVEEGRTGLLVDPASPAALAAGLRDVLERPDLGRSLGEAGRRRVEAHFRAATMARRVESIYEEALHARRAA